MEPAKTLLYIVPLLFLLTLVITPFFKFGLETIPIEESPKLHGNFLHITDFHPDPYYVSNVTAKSRCHGRFTESKRPKHMKKGISGPWGAPATVCDSPLGLIDATFEWLENNWKDKIDFIIWTGDNARHDNDDNIPRTPKEMFQSIRMITEKFLKTFGKPKSSKRKNRPHFIPIVPSIGNNDIHPNNIILPGPNDILTILHEIWSPFIPKKQHKTFLNGGYFYTEVIPGKLLVVSLNTLYFYKANTAVNGCKARDQAGTIEMRWLNDVLKRARKLGMKVYLTGHVAPRSKQYSKSCYRKYGRLAIKYHDLILGHFYGHSNMDHFFFIGNKRRRRFRPVSTDDNDVLSKDEDIHDKEVGEEDDEYDEEDDEYDEEDEEDDEYDEEDDEYDDDDEVNDELDDEVNDEVNDEKNEETNALENREQKSFEVSQESQQDEQDEEKGKVKTNVYSINRYMNKLLRHYRNVPITKGVEKEYAVIHINPSIIPTFFPALRIFNYNTTEVTNKDDDEVNLTRKHKKPVKSHPDSPTHTNTFLTPLGYTQYFINLTEANLHPNITPEFTVEYTTWDDYHMNDLTFPSWVQLARRIVNNGFRGSLRKKFLNHLLVGTRELIREKRRRDYVDSNDREKGPEDYIISELSF